MLYRFDDLTFGIVSVGRFLHRDGFFEVKARPYAALAWRQSGSAEFEIAGKRFVSRAGDVLFLPADTPYRVDYSGSQIIVAHLSDCSYTAAENYTLGKAAIEMRFERLLELWQTRHSVNQAKSLLYDILDAIADDKTLGDEDAVLAACVAYIEEHAFDPELDVEAVSARGFMSTSGLQRAFGKHFGMSPKQYLIKRRMEHALTLLATGERTVKEIAFAVGYRDEKYFSRAFKKRYGYPPSRLGGAEMGALR